MHAPLTRFFGTIVLSGGSFPHAIPDETGERGRGDGKGQDKQRLQLSNQPATQNTKTGIGPSYSCPVGRQHGAAKQQRPAQYSTAQSHDQRLRASSSACRRAQHVVITTTTIIIIATTTILGGSFSGFSLGCIPAGNTFVAHHLDPGYCCGCTRLEPPRDRLSG